MTQTKQIELLGLSKMLSKQDFAEFLGYVEKTNSLGVLDAYLGAFDSMLREGCDPSNSMAWAYVDALEESERIQAQVLG